MSTRMIEFCRRLVQTPSFSGQEKAVAEIIAGEMKALGYDQVWFDKFGSVMGRVKGSGQGPTVLFDGHIDTVTVSDMSQWSRDPFAAEVSEGRIYGRGTTDMKGAVAAMVYAAAAIIDSGVRPAGDIVVSGTVQEENFEGIALGSVLDEVKADVVVIGEATQLKLNIGQRGRAELAVHTFGRSAHSANPESGLNAVTKMSRVIKGIEVMEPSRDEVLGQGIGVITDIISNPYPGSSVVPNHCRLTVDRRLLVGEDEAAVLAQFTGLLDRLKDHDPEFTGQAELVKGEAVCYTGETIAGLRFFPAWLMDGNSSMVTRARDALKGAGLEGTIGVFSFCTNGSQSAGVRGIPTIGFGPSRENLAHAVDEYIEISQLAAACTGYIALARSLAR